MSVFSQDSTDNEQIRWVLWYQLAFLLFLSTAAEVGFTFRLSRCFWPCCPRGLSWAAGVVSFRPNLDQAMYNGKRSLLWKLETAQSRERASVARGTQNYILMADLSCMSDSNVWSMREHFNILLKSYTVEATVIIEWQFAFHYLLYFI